MEDPEAVVKQKDRWRRVLLLLLLLLLAGAAASSARHRWWLLKRKRMQEVWGGHSVAGTEKSFGNFKRGGLSMASLATAADAVVDDSLDDAPTLPPGSRFHN
jgi:hypothetical protein